MGAKNPGLWHGRRRVEIQDVKSSHKVACCDCLNQPVARRLVVTDGGGRSAVTTVRCIACGVAWIGERKAEASRAIARLETGVGSIRL